MAKAWCGYDNKAKNIKHFFVGKNGIARKCVAGYVGVNGKARKVFPIVEFPIVEGDGTYTYDGIEKKLIISNLDEEYVAKSGVSQGTNVGTYTTNFFLNDNHAIWEDKTTAPISKTIIINKRDTYLIINVPTLLEVCHSNGEFQGINRYGGDVAAYSYYADGTQCNLPISIECNDSFFNYAELTNYCYTKANFHPISDSEDITYREEDHGIFTGENKDCYKKMRMNSVNMWNNMPYYMRPNIPSYVSSGNKTFTLSLSGDGNNNGFSTTITVPATVKSV